MLRGRLQQCEARGSLAEARAVAEEGRRRLEEARGQVAEARGEVECLLKEEDRVPGVAELAEYRRRIVELQEEGEAHAESGCLLPLNQVRDGRLTFALGHRWQYLCAVYREVCKCAITSLR